MNIATTELDTEQVITKPPAVEVKVGPSEVNPPPLSSQGVRKGDLLPSSIIGGLIAAFITSTAMVVTHAWIVPTVARHQKRIDRMYQAMFDADQSARLLYGYTWNIWYERQRTSGATNKPLEDLQQSSAKAASLTRQLSLIFGDQLAGQWNVIVDGYRDIGYPITHPGEFPTLATEKAMNDTLNPLTQSAGEILTRMQQMIHEMEHRLW